MTKALYEHSKVILGTGLKALFPGTTRWSSLDITYTRAIKLRPAMTRVCYDNGVEEITPEDFKLMEEVVQITGPFRAFVKKLQQESVPTISLVFSGITGLVDLLGALHVRERCPK